MSPVTPAPGRIEADALAATALALARDLAGGATLWCVAPEWPEHARHLAVEFVHPVVVGCRAVPAVSVTSPDPARTLDATAAPGDVLAVIAPAASATALDLVHAARPRGLRSLWIGAGPRPTGAPADHLVWIDGEPAAARHDGRLVLRYHLLWELTQVCFAQPGDWGGDPTGFLYPFLDGDTRGTDTAPLLADLAASATAKADEHDELRHQVLTELAGPLDAAARDVADRLGNGGRLLSFGNGGSATDAAGLAALFAEPPGGARPLGARSLVDDQAVLSALANDVGYDVVFARQVLAHGRAGDVAVGLSTSGASANVLAALDAAAGAGLCTVGLAGGDGAAMAASTTVDHCLVVPGLAIHRIQEAQAAIGHDLWRRVQQALA